jgi:hypothetical protein
MFGTCWASEGNVLRQLYRVVALSRVWERGARRTDGRDNWIFRTQFCNTWSAKVKSRSHLQQEHAPFARTARLGESKVVDFCNKEAECAKLDCDYSERRIMLAPRISADFNRTMPGPVQQMPIAVTLDTFGSLRDLSNAGIVLRSGVTLIAFNESDEVEDLEGEGVVRFDTEFQRWVIEFDERGVRNVPASGQRGPDYFRCVHCREPVPGVTCQTAWKPDFSCDNCGTSVLAAIAPPEYPSAH